MIPTNQHEKKIPKLKYLSTIQQAFAKNQNRQTSLTRYTQQWRKKKYKHSVKTEDLKHPSKWRIEGNMDSRAGRPKTLIKAYQTFKTYVTSQIRKTTKSKELTKKLQVTEIPRKQTCTYWKNKTTSKRNKGCHIQQTSNQQEEYGKNKTKFSEQ